VANPRLYPAEAADPFCLGTGEAEQLLAGHPWRRFAVLGDSIAEGLGDPTPGYPDESWCDRIAAELRQTRPGLAYLNLGAANSTAARVRARQLPGAVAFGPDLALVACGGYDALRFSYDLGETERELRAIITALTQSGATVMTTGLFDGSYAPGIAERLRGQLRERLHELSRRMRAVSADLGTLHVELTWHPASRDPGLYSKDPRHGTRRGHAIAAAESVRCLGAYLGTGQSAVPASPGAGPGGRAAVPDDRAAVPDDSAAVPDDSAAVPDDSAAGHGGRAAVADGGSALPGSAAR
jgi:lysophospholipase L1-like esterase